MTGLGKELRIIRIKKDENLYDMATKLGISTSYLSSIENGIRNMSNDLIEKLQEVYQLTETQVQKIKEEADKQKKSVHIDLNGLSESQKCMTLYLSRTLDNLNDDKCEEIINILRRENE